MSQCRKQEKNLLVHLLGDKDITSALVFSRTKHGANKIAGDLTKAGFRAEAIHGNKSQNARQAALGNFKNGRLRVLVATDIAARGIDIDELSHVVNYDLPNIPETYVHRIGRTGRAGASGIALSFCDSEELPYLKDIQKLTGQVVPVERDHPFAADLSAPGIPEARGAKKQPPKVVKTPAPQRPGTIPLPERRPDTKREDQRNRPARDAAPAKSDDNRNDNNRRPARDERRSDRPARDERRADRPGRDERRPERRDDNRSERPARDDRNNERRNNNGRSEQRSSRPERPARSTEERIGDRTQPKKPSAAEVASVMRNRFASILEVASIEKQDRPQKPKPKYGEREERNRDAKPGADTRPAFRGDKKKKRW